MELKRYQFPILYNFNTLMEARFKKMLFIFFYCFTGNYNIKFSYTTRSRAPISSRGTNLNCAIIVLAIPNIPLSTLPINVW